MLRKPNFSADGTDGRGDKPVLTMIYEKLSGEIIGAAMAVLNDLGPGLDEKIYERASVIELRKCAHTVGQQKNFPVH